MSVEHTFADSRNSNRTRFYWAAVVLLFGLFAFQLWFHATRTSATVDEPNHILAGYRHLQCGDFGINPEHPPLLKMLAAAPLMFRDDLIDPPWECGSKLTSKFDTFSYGNTFLVENGVDSIVIPTRLFAAVLSLLLAILVFAVSWEMFDRWVAIVALAIFAFEPNLIGHGSIITTDMAIATTSFGAVYSIYRFCKEQSWTRFAIVGLAFGLMLAAKHSAVIFLPILLVLLILDAFLFRKGPGSIGRAVTRRSAAFAGAFVIGMIILWSFYGFRYRAVPDESAARITVTDYIRENASRPEPAQSMPAKVTAAIEQTRLFPESYVLGMADVISWGNRNTFIFGKNYPTGQWFYFPVAFAVKSNIALLLLFPLGLLVPLLMREKRREALFLLLPAITFFAVATTSTFTTGVRHILPVYPFLIVAAAAGSVWLARRHRLIAAGLILLLVCNAVAAVRTAPSYLAFANDLWGGTDSTRRVFSGGNVNTGQNIKLINEYIAKHDIKECWIADFVHPEMLPHVQPCRTMPSLLRILVSRNPIAPVPPVIEGTIFLASNELPPQGADEYIPIAAKSEPETVIGGSILVYRGRFEVPLVAAISHVQRSGAFLRRGQTDEAIADARQALAYSTDDPRPHLALGLARARAGATNDARASLETAISLARGKPVFRNQEARAEQELSKMK
ncbi:MAG: glycosyltransferase family 39 protein [Blastocatellia bacterium]